MPTAEVKAWYKDILSIGCIVCYNNHIASTGEVHHLLSGGRKIGDMVTICLCQIHHRGGFNDGIVVSRHPYRKSFQQAYGTESELYEQTKRLVSELRGGKQCPGAAEEIHPAVQIPIRDYDSKSISPDTGKDLLLRNGPSEETQG